ncbi:uncharacterized protein BX664DRAFT_331084 [Halteromyces radiatus]|uniref:uncharacterized protein n=1 Tax=Halteromyces radiatus TaxID=101107 RepID=UPI00221FFBE1|nr:uncharacterized protein BX664DRAFT_331084 [Halteromyces radiatus]KAI8088676.1 hypothetical protein BX664DRAFT_331084 [Halteromyces radiatus]
MAVSLLAYVVTFFVFTCSYILTILALALPKWLTFITPAPFYTETNYGLFQICRSFAKCRAFPSGDNGDCGEDGFCELWRGAAAGMVLSAILGAFVLLALLGTMCSGRRKRAKAWMTLAGLFVIYAIPQVLSMGIVAYLYNSSSTFYIGTRYNVSFILCIISWCLSIFLAVILSIVAFVGPPEYAYNPIDS